MSVATKQELIDLIQSHDAELKAFGVKRLGLFGSYVRNEPKPESDVDLLVEFTPGQKTFHNFMDLGFFLEELFGRKVDFGRSSWNMHTTFLWIGLFRDIALICSCGSRAQRFARRLSHP